MSSWTKHPSATFFTAQAQGNNEVIWLSVFAAWSCFVPAGDVRETSINSAILSTNCSVRGYEESGAIYFSMKNKYIPLKKPGAEIQTKLNGLVHSAELHDISHI